MRKNSLSLSVRMALLCTKQSNPFTPGSCFLAAGVSSFLIAGLLFTFGQVANGQNTAVPAPADPTSNAQQNDATKPPPLSAIERGLKGGETHSYKINLKGGQFLHAVVEQKGVDVVVVLFAPDGKQITDTDSPNDRWGTEPILLVAPTAGDYRVDIRSPNGRAPAGRYAVRIIALREATGADKDYATAEKTFDEARKLRAQQTGDARRAAIKKYEEAALLFRAAGDTYRTALSLSSIGNTYAQLNEFRKALGYFNDTLSLSQALGDRRLEAATETFLGGANDVLGEVQKALDHYNRALSLSRESENRSSEASALNNIGLIYSQGADWQNALEYYLRALPLFQSLGNQQNEAIALHNIGLAYDALGEQPKALEYFQRALNLRRTTGDKDSQSLTLSSVGLAYRKMGDLTR